MTTEQKSALPDLLDPFEKFAYEPVYVRLNREFVERVEFKPGDVVADLACGPGNIAELVIPKIGSGGTIFEIDPNDKAIAASKKRHVASAVNIIFIQGRAEDLFELPPNLENQIDTVICGNAVHNFADREKAFGNVFRILKAGGTFAFNTGFFEGSVPEEEQATFLGRWIRHAMRIAVADLGVVRTKGRTEKVEASPIKDLSPAEYEDLLEQSGFIVEKRGIQTWMLPLSAYHAIAEDPEFLAGAMSKLPPDIATIALQNSLDFFVEEGKTASPRDWLTVIAHKH